MPNAMRAAEGAVAECAEKVTELRVRKTTDGQRRSGKVSFDGQRNQLGRRLHTQHASFRTCVFRPCEPKVENGGDFLHPPALDDETQHIALAPRELDLVTTPLIEGGEDIFGDRGREIGAAVQHFVDRVNQLVPGRVLQEERGRAGAWPWRRRLPLGAWSG